MCVLISTAVCLGFTHWTNSKALLVLTGDFPDYGAPRVTEHYEENCVSITFTFLHEILIRYVEFDIMRGKYNIKRH